jgi:hypothetical protein
MATHSTTQWCLPCRAEREQIVEAAKLVLAEARAIAERLDRTQAMLSTGWSNQSNWDVSLLANRNGEPGASFARTGE